MSDINSWCQFSVWSRVHHYGIATVRTNTSLQLLVQDNLGTLQIMFQKKNKIFLTQYFGLHFRLKVKQEPKSRECNVHKRLNFLRFSSTSLNKCYGGGGGRKVWKLLTVTHCLPCWNSYIRHCQLFIKSYKIHSDPNTINETDSCKWWDWIYYPASFSWVCNKS